MSKSASEIKKELEEIAKKNGWGNVKYRIVKALNEYHALYLYFDKVEPSSFKSQINFVINNQELKTEDGELTDYFDDKITKKTLGETRYHIIGSFFSTTFVTDKDWDGVEDAAQAIAEKDSESLSKPEPEPKPEPKNKKFGQSYYKNMLNKSLRSTKK